MGTPAEAIEDRSRAIYAQAYDEPAAIRAGNRWYEALHEDIEDAKKYPSWVCRCWGWAGSTSPSSRR
jgi:hypothetical protein